MKQLQFGEYAVVPAVVFDDADDAAPLAEALDVKATSLCRVTFRPEAAEEFIHYERKFSEMPRQVPILTVDQAASSSAAGAKFIVSPGFDPKHRRLPPEKIFLFSRMFLLPVAQAWIKRGLKVVKFFPAEARAG